MEMMAEVGVRLQLGMRLQLGVLRYNTPTWECDNCSLLHLK